MDEESRATAKYDLPSVIRDIVERLIQDDWVRLRSPNGRDAYYVLGARAWDEERDGQHTYDVEMRAPTRLSARGQHLVRAGIAAVSADSYVQRAGQKLERSGISIEQATALLRGEEPQLSISDGGLEAFANYLEALIAAKVARGELGLDSELMAELTAAREKVYLREMATRYSKVVKRSALLEPLGFADSQLQEACQCYLYGFYRAAITVAAAAVENALKSRLRVRRFEKYGELINKSAQEGLLGSDAALAEVCKQIFDRRNDVVHKALEPNKEDAETILGLARRVVAHLVEAPPSASI